MLTIFKVTYKFNVVKPQFSKKLYVDINSFIKKWPENGKTKISL